VSEPVLRLIFNRALKISIACIVATAAKGWFERKADLLILCACAAVKPVIHTSRGEATMAMGQAATNPTFAELVTMTACGYLFRDGK
jgi:hypothetical protein